MVDFHSHILPKIDDGSNTIATSCKLLRMLQHQGVDTVCLTPHFFADTVAVSDFLVHRQQSFDSLQKALDISYPRLLLGAEVSYYLGISRMQDLKKLRLQGSKILLLEMPFRIWSKEVVHEIIQIAEDPDITLLLAHIERYVALQSRDTLEELLSYGVAFQSNAELFYLPIVRNLANSCVRDGKIHVLGTDTHDSWLRAPHMDIALRAISHQLGESFVHSYISQHQAFLIRNSL